MVRQFLTLAVIQLCIFACLLANILHAQQAEGQASPAAPISYKHATNPRLDALGDDLPPSAIVRFGTSRFQHPSSAHAAALSPDGKQYVTMGQQELVVWDTQTGRKIWSESFGQQGVSGSAYGQGWLAFADSSETFYTPGKTSEIICWDAKSGDQRKVQVQSKLTGGVLARLTGSVPTTFKCIQVTSSADAFFLGGAKGLVKVNAKGEELWSQPNAHDSPAEGPDGDGRDRLWFGGQFTLVQLSPDEQLVAAVFGQAPKKLQILKATTGELLREIPLTANLVRCAFSLDSRTITATERDCGLRQYDVETGVKRWELAIPPAENAESYLTDLVHIAAPQSLTEAQESTSGVGADILAVGAAIGADHAIYLVNAADGNQLDVLRGHSWKPWGLQFDTVQRVLYSTGWEGTIRRWDVDQRQQLPLPQGIRGGETLALSPDGKLAAYVDDSSTIHLVSLDGFREIRSFPVEVSSVQIVHFSADSQTLYAGGASLDELFVAGWNVQSGQATSRGTWPKGRDPHSSIEELVTSNDESVLGVAVFRQSKAYLSNRNDGSQIAELPHAEVYGMDLSPDGSLAVTVGWDEQMRVWSTADGRLLKQKLVSEAIGEGDADLRMYGICFNGDGTQVAAAHMGGLISVWNVDNEGELTLAHSFKSGWFIFGAIDFSADGCWILAGDASGKVVLYDASNGQAVWTVDGHDDHVYTLQLHPSQRMAVSGGSGMGYVWSLVPETLPDAEFEALYEQLLDDNGRSYYSAMWKLATGPDDLLDKLDQRLAGVSQVVDLGKIRSGDSVLAQRRVDLAQKAIASNPQADSWQRMRLGLLALSLNNSPRARTLLEQHASQHASEQVKAFAEQLLRFR